MKNVNAKQLRQMWFDFFRKHGHAIIGSASLIPENDPTVLFTTAGMHPLVPYLLGEKHPAGNRLTDVQICVRTGDIEEVGDPTHCTFFEMLGRWSLGDYFKEYAISCSYDFLLNHLEFDKSKFAVTVFKGDEDCPRDDESAEFWKKMGVPEDRIFFLPKENNWWGPAGVTGPCGPDTEMFIDTGKPKCSDGCSPACDCGKYVEIGNDVFMQYFKNADGTFSPLKQKNVDEGMGLERMLCILNGYKSVYETDLFKPAIALIENLSGHKYDESETVTKAMRIIADHIRTSTFLIGDVKGIVPSNVDQGYILRRLIRRAVRFGRIIDLPERSLSKIAEQYISQYQDVYQYLLTNKDRIVSELDKEEIRFSNTVQQGLKEFEKVITHIPTKTISGKTAFRLYDTFGFPIEMTEELAHENGFEVDVQGYEDAFKEHQKKSQAGAEQKFHGGLADNSEETAKLHTATHLLHSALMKVLGGEARQRGSNITAERLRFDFGFDRAMTADEIKAVEDLVNEQIKKNIPVVCEEMTVDEAKAQGAIGIFDNKYGEKVKVYTIGDFSKEICGGPHASNTGDLKSFKITKEQSSSAGVRRIKAVIGQ